MIDDFVEIEFDLAWSPPEGIYQELLEQVEKHNLSASVLGLKMNRVLQRQAICNFVLYQPTGEQISVVSVLNTG